MSIANISSQIAKLSRQLTQARADGDIELAEDLEDQIETLEDELDALDDGSMSGSREYD